MDSPVAVRPTDRLETDSRLRLWGAGMGLAFTLAVFLSAALLFVVEPMFGKLVLPLLGGSPAVWITGDSALCQALLFAVQPTVPPPAPAPPPGAPPAPAAPAAPGGPSPVPADIASRIQKVSDTEYNVDRAVVDKILENQAELMRSARIVPEQKDGKVVGIRLFGIRPDTLLGTLGFQNGDRLEAINGFNMASPEKALEAYARLRTASNLNVKINRRGQNTSIDYRIK